MRSPNRSYCVSKKTGSLTAGPTLITSFLSATSAFTKTKTSTLTYSLHTISEINSTELTIATACNKIRFDVSYISFSIRPYGMK
ncbi:MAG: hypothetical protein U9N54_07050 [candidate division Zixibacteria bacterium]|nr:hypothetical protein [candidate division Zixibacteria bacterium]